MPHEDGDHGTERNRARGACGYLEAVRDVAPLTRGAERLRRYLDPIERDAAPRRGFWSSASICGDVDTP